MSNNFSLPGLTGNTIFFCLNLARQFKGRFVLLTGLACCWLFQPAFSQDLQWLRQMAGSQLANNSQGNDMAVDAAGNVYVVGTFSGTIDFNAPGTPYPVTSISGYGGGDIFFAKYNASGAVQWVKKIGAVNGFCVARGVALYTDPSNNVFLYISGTYTSTNGFIISVDFDPSNFTQPLTMNGLDGDAFVAKYWANDGRYVWATTVNNSGAFFLEGGKIATDASGNAYTISTKSGQTRVASLKKFTYVNGTLSQQSVSVGSDGYDIAFRNNRLYICGYGLGPYALPIAWYSTSLVFQLSTGASGRIYNRIALDNASNIYLAGGTGSGSTIAIEKYDDNGTLFWTRSYVSGITDGMAVDLAWGGSTGGVMVAGWFKGTTNFNNGASGYSLTSSGAGTIDDIFVARYSDTGNCEWVKNNTSTTANGTLRPIAVACSNYFTHVLGFVYNRTINARLCGGTSNVAVTNSGNGYLAKYAQKLFAPGTISGPASSLPGETEEYSISPVAGAINYTWYVPAGWTITYTSSDKTYIFVTIGNIGTSGDVAVSASSNCGTSSLGRLYVTVTGSGGGHRIAVSPNPATDQLNVSVESTQADTVSQAPVTSIAGYDVKLYDRYSQVRLAGRTTNDLLRLNTSNLPADTYFLHASRGDEIIRKQIMVQH